MSLFAIADLHLSIKNNKPMDIFGEHWKDHHLKIQQHWYEHITEDDTILIPGDISWAMTLEEAKADLEWIHDLPGKKILLQGNHDYWWNATSKLNQIYPDMIFLKNGYAWYEDYGICGTRGWVCPNDTKFTLHDDKIYKREQARLRLSLEAAKQAGLEKIICMLHYPPTNDKKEPSGFMELMQQYPIQLVVYGHLHGLESFETGLKGNIGGVQYHLVSCDYLDFQPMQIL